MENIEISIDKGIHENINIVGIFLKTLLLILDILKNIDKGILQDRSWSVLELFEESVIITRSISDKIIFGWTLKGLIDMDRALSSITSCVSKKKCYTLVQ